MDLLFVFLQQYLICKKYRQVWCLILKTLLFTYVQYTILELSLVTMEPLMIKKKERWKDTFTFSCKGVVFEFLWVPTKVLHSSRNLHYFAKLLRSLTKRIVFSIAFSHKTIGVSQWKFVFTHKTFAFSRKTFAFLQETLRSFTKVLAYPRENLCFNISIFLQKYCVPPRNFFFFFCKNICIQLRDVAFTCKINEMKFFTPI